MKPNSSTQAYFLSAIIVTIVCMFALSRAEAQERKPSKQDIEHLENIKENQRGILERETWNQSEVDALNANSWVVQWSKNPDEIKLVEPSFQ